MTATNPGDALLAELGFTVLIAAPFEDHPGVSLFGNVEVNNPQEAWSDARTADARDHYTTYDQVVEGERVMQTLGWTTAAAAEREALDKLRAFLTDAKAAGHDTFFVRAPLTTVSSKDFLGELEIHRSFVRGRSWNSKL